MQTFHCLATSPVSEYRNGSAFSVVCETYTGWTAVMPVCGVRLTISRSRVALEQPSGDLKQVQVRPASVTVAPAVVGQVG